MIEEVLKSLDKAVVFNVEIYDMKNITPFYDYSVIASVNSSRQGMAAIEYLKDDAAINNFPVLGYSKNPDSEWFLIDLGEVVVHIFVGEWRKHYNLDEMYANRS